MTEWGESRLQFDRFRIPWLTTCRRARTSLCVISTALASSHIVGQYACPGATTQSQRRCSIRKVIGGIRIVVSLAAITSSALKKFSDTPDSRSACCLSFPICLPCHSNIPHRKQTSLYRLAKHALFRKANIVRSWIKLQLFWNRVDPLLTEQGFPGCDKKIKGRPPASIDDSDASALLEWQRVCVIDWTLFLDEEDI